MMKGALGTAAAAVFATAIAGAQAPAAQQEQHSERQMVTVEGCLQHDGAGSARVADASRDDDKTFMLVSAQVQSGASASASESATGAAGATAQAERPVGTSGTAAAATKFKVTGLDDDRLAQYAGQRVRIQGHIEDSDRAGEHRSSDMARADADRPAADAAGGGTPGAAGTSGTTTSAPESATAGTTASTAHRSHDAMSDVAKLKASSIEAASGSCPPSSDNR